MRNRSVNFSGVDCGTYAANDVRVLEVFNTLLQGKKLLPGVLDGSTKSAEHSDGNEDVDKDGTSKFSFCEHKSFASFFMEPHT